MAIEYSVVVKEGVTKADIIDSLSRDTTLDSSVNSNEVPDRAIAMSTSQQRPHNSRVFEVELEAEEAIILNNNPEVSAVEVPLEFNESWAAAQTLLLNRNDPGALWNSTDGFTQDNYGLWRHSNTVNDFAYDQGTITREWANTAEAGLGVDIFVMDGDMPRWDLTEFDDQTVAGDIVPTRLNGYNAGSRFVSLDWSEIDPILPKRFVGTGAWTNNNRGEIGYDWFISDCTNDAAAQAAGYLAGWDWARKVSGHATASMSLVGGNRFGWAKQARLYAMPMRISFTAGIPGWWPFSQDARSTDKSDAVDNAWSGENTGVGAKYYFDAITMFHNWKKAQVAAENTDYAVPGSDPLVVRPTVVTASVCPVNQYTDITGVYFRGSWFGDVLDTLQDDTYPTLTGSGWPASTVQGSNSVYGWGTSQGPVPPIYKFGIGRGANPSQFGDLFKTSGRPVQHGPFFPTQAPAMQADAHEMTDAGVIFVTCGHNTGLKMDIPGGLDYDNFFTTKETSFDEETAKLASVGSTAAAGRIPEGNWVNMQTLDLNAKGPYNWMRSSGQPVFYNRGGTHFSNNTIVVGNMNHYTSIGLVPAAVRTTYPEAGSELADDTSSRGPRNDIWAAGNYTTAVDAAAVPGGYVHLHSGTSAAVPQVAGMVAILAGKYPTTTPAQMRAFVRSNSDFHSSNGIIDYHALLGGITPVTSPVGANGDFAYFATKVYNLESDPLLGATTNVAYLNPTTPYDPSQLTVLETDLDYFGHSNPAKYDAVIADPHLYSNLNYTSEMSEKFKPRVGSNWGFQYYKFIGYHDFERTIPSGEGSDFGQDHGGSAISNLIIYERTDDGGERVLLGGNQEILTADPSSARILNYTEGVTREKSDGSHLGSIGFSADKGVGPVGPPTDTNTADFEVGIVKIPYAVSNNWIKNTPGASASLHGEASWGGFWYYFGLPFKDGSFRVDGEGVPYGVATGICSNCTRKHKLGTTWNSTTDAWGHEYFLGSSKWTINNDRPIRSIDKKAYPAYWLEEGTSDNVYYPHHALSCFNHNVFFDSRGASVFRQYYFDFETGIEGAPAAKIADLGEWYNMGAPPCNYSFIPADNAPTEILIDFGREVTISNIKWNTLSHNHFNTSYIDVYGSNVPFYPEESGPIEGSIKIAELNRGDAYIANIHFTDPIAGQAQTASGRWKIMNYDNGDYSMLRSQGIVGFGDDDPYANGVMAEPGDLMITDRRYWRTGWSDQLSELEKMNPMLAGQSKNSSLGGPSKNWSSSTPSANISS